MADMVDIEWVGDPPILDELTKVRIQLGEIPPSAAEVIRGAEAQRLRPIVGVTKRRVDQDSFHTSEEYIFGPNVFVTSVKAKDVDKILGSSSGHQFQRVGDPANDIIRPAMDIAFVSEVEGVSLRDIFQ